MQRICYSNYDKPHDYLRECHSYRGIFSHKMQIFFCYVWFATPYFFNFIFNTSSSASSDACQKKRYGDMVVPNSATNIIANEGVSSKCGTMVATSTSGQF